MKELFISVVLAGFWGTLMITGNDTKVEAVPQAPVQIAQVKEISPILRALKLPDCEISMGEQNHHKSENGHVFATDISCPQDYGFPVYAPTSEPFYVVQHVGTDKRLGTYVILKHGDIRYVFAHTDADLASLSPGQRVNAGDMVGETNETGIATGIHLHIERWEGARQVSWSWEVNQYSDRLCEQRGWSFCKKETPPARFDVVLKRSSEMVRRYEGLRLKAYPDTPSRWSIGYGTPSYPGEHISKAEATRRFEERLSKTVKVVQKDFPKATEDQQIALVSLAFNCWETGYLAVKEKGFEVHKTWICLKKWYSGLEVRRAEEAKLLFKKL